MKGFSNRWKDFPDYILGVTREIWEDRGIGTLQHSYAPDIPVRTPMGLSRGNSAVIAATMATCHEFPDRQLFGEDVIWSEHDTGYLSSHRILTTGTHARDGMFGVASGRKFMIRVIADCAAREDVIFDEWLVRDYGGIVRQLGMDPAAYAAGLIEAEGGPERATPPFVPEMDVDGGYQGTGNDNAWGQRYADTLRRIMQADFTHIHRSYDRAVVGAYPGAQTTLGVDETTGFWLGLRSAFPDARFEVHHVIGMDGGMMPPRAAVRWSLTGTHAGWGSFGRPSGARVHVMGLAHAEFGPFGPDGVGLRREFALYDEIAIWKQILLHQG